MEVIPEQGTILTITENGFGKKSDIESYRLGSRGNMGVMNIKSSDRNGPVVGSVLVSDDDEIMLITQIGKIIRLRVNQIRNTGRVTQGVRLINLDEDEKVVSAAKIVSDKEDEADEVIVSDDVKISEQAMGSEPESMSGDESSADFEESEGSSEDESGSEMEDSTDVDET